MESGARGDHSAAGGFTLLEAILAVAIFSTFSVAAITAYRSMGEASWEVEQEVRIRTNVISLLNEAAFNGRLTEVEDTVETEDDGATYDIVVEEVEGLENEEGDELTELYRIRVTGSLRDQPDWPPFEASTLIYRPLYER